MQMIRLPKQLSRRADVCLLTAFSCLFLLLTLAGCGGGGSESREYVFVAVPDASLRDRVSTLYTKTGLVHNGERLQVLERMQNKRFVRVRSPRGEEGWIQERYLADQQTFDEFQRMAAQYKDAPPQATGRVEEQVKVHVLPGRKTEYLYLLNEKEKVDLLKRQTVNRNAAPLALKDEKARSTDKSADKEDKDEDDDDSRKSDQPAILEDWWLVRDQQKRVGWIYGRTVYLDVPDEIAQYSEGQRIVAAFPLDQVQDEGKQVSEYLVLFTDNKDGMPYDFNQVRVFTWNSRKHHYETAYRERELTGILPVTLGQQDFDREGKLRTFTLNLKSEDGNVRQQLYKFNPPIVRKVYAAGEVPPSRSRRKKAEATSRGHSRQG